jgi:hypothetical protein
MKNPFSGSFSANVGRNNGSSVSSRIINQKDVKLKFPEEFEWNVDVSSEDLETYRKAEKFMNSRSPKKKKLDLFMSCRNIVMKSTSQINQTA